MDEKGAKAEATPSDVVGLPDGEALPWEAVQAHMRDKPTRLVVLAGAAESGKTTILTSLYELLLEAPIGGLSFSGSRTLVGFERRTHEGRMVSGRGEATTLRTPTGEGFRFLHLRLANGSGGSLHDLMLSDVSGEFFRAAADTTEGCRRLSFLPYAERLVLVLDGERVASQEHKYKAFADMRMVLRGLFDARMLNHGTSVTLVLAKLDLLVDSQGTPKRIEGLDELRCQLLTLAEQKGLPFSYLEVAARPINELVPFAHGVPTLVKAWVNAETPRAVMPVVTASRTPAAGRSWSFVPRSWKKESEAPNYELEFI